MLKKHSIVLCILVSLILLLIAVQHYPGGTNFDANSIGFSWKNNYISNLFGEKAVNGMDNGARFWAMGGMIFHSIGFSIFFTQFSKRIPVKSGANVVKYIGIAGMVFTFLIATPLHDIMVTISSTLYLICMFYITIFIFKSKLHVFKVCCIVYLLVFYGIMYIYGSGDFRQYLPILQKGLFAFTAILIISLHYFTTTEDFKLKPIKNHVHT